MVEALKQSFMECQLSCTSPLPQVWVIETLARSNQIDISLLLDLLEKTPEASDDLGRNAREFVSLRILQSFFVHGARTNPVSSAPSQKIRLDPSDDSCEDVLRRILTEISPSHLKTPGPEMSKWDLQPFIEHKRSSLAGYALQQLKNAMLSGSHSFLASLKERSGLPDANQSEHVTAVDDGNCNGITPRHEGSDTNDGDLSQRDLPDENLEAVNRKRRTTSKNAGDTTSENLILSRKGCENHIKSVKKFKHDIICSEQNVVEKLIFSSVDALLTNRSTECSLGRTTHFGEMGLNGPPNDDRCTSSKGLVGPDEVLPCEMQVPCCDTEVNNKSEVEQGQDHCIEEAKRDKEGFCDLTLTEDVNKKFEQNTRSNILNGGEVEEVDISSDVDGNNDDRTDIATEENASFSCNHAPNQDSLGKTNWIDQDLPVDTSRRYSVEERCSLGEKTDVEVIGQNGPPGDSNDMCTSLEGLVGHDEVLLHERQAPHSTPQCQNDKSDGEERQDHENENAEGDENGLHGVRTTDEDMDKLHQNVLRNVPSVGEAEEDVDISTDIDGYQDERTNINTKKKTFLSSQCTYSQDSLATTDWRELNLCVKCNLSGNLLVCSNDSCLLVIHQSCLGSDATFGATGEFYCPFCAYSRAILKYTEIKKKAALARKDLATLICLGTQKGSKKQPQRLCKMNQNHLEHDDGLPKSNELNTRDTKKVSNSQRRKKLEYEQAGPSEYRPSFGKKAVDSTNRIAHTLNKDKQEVNRTRQVSHSPKAHGRHQMAARAIRKSQGEITSGQVLGRSGGSDMCANIRSKKGILYPPETDLSRENKSLRSPESADAEDTSEEENENSGASKYFIRVRKQERNHSYPAIPQLRRKRLPWTSEEEDKLKEGMRVYCSPHDKIIPWKTILEHGADEITTGDIVMNVVAL
ncbi:probable inactive leucine-rich repeat receptor-like protein kinase at3g03770 [Phtheirospermum japonicum]|uniref:Probable inactive leucine-rich repeat receptor-like protein kinase at3g03770 n=1 Tax=Phtheirospermum japonicum TaxID=374723 RepID=A0A830BEC8_9LAMI|nr:probable inactive leucine-rich repeat receptor-like protein kinase at3g03770 [Phtheirospermum japonicum]